MEIFQLSPFQWLKQNCINICYNTCGFLISSLCLLCSLISKQNFRNQPLETWHDWEDWWCLKCISQLLLEFIYLTNNWLPTVGDTILHAVEKNRCIISCSVLLEVTQLHGFVSVEIILNVYWKINISPCHFT